MLAVACSVWERHSLISDKPEIKSHREREREYSSGWQWCLRTRKVRVCMFCSCLCGLLPGTWVNCPKVWMSVWMVICPVIECFSLTVGWDQLRHPCEPLVDGNHTSPLIYNQYAWKYSKCCFFCSSWKTTRMSGLFLLCQTCRAFFVSVIHFPPCVLTHSPACGLELGLLSSKWRP